MSEETIVSTAPETLNPAPTIVETPEPTTQEATDTAAPESEVPEAKPEKTAEQKELEYLRRKATKADRNNARLYQEAQTYRQQLEKLTPAAEGQPQPTQDPYQLAKEIAAVERITEKANAIAEEGKKRFSATWDTALSTVISEAGPLFDIKGRPTPLGEAVMDVDKPADLIKFLGDNPDLAEQLEGLSPVQLGRRIERLEAQMNAPKVKPTSSAPAPIKPLAGNASSATNVDLEKADMEQYKAIRAKQGARWAR